jgi:hypothetical protein
MTHRSILSRLAITSLAVALLATAPASAMPTGPHGTSTTDPRQQDMHASTVQPAGEVPSVDMRGEAAAGGGGTGSTGPAAQPSLPGPPTWPTNPTPLPRPTQQPVATDGGNDIDVDLPVALLILTGTLAVGGGAAFAVIKGRTPTGVAH